MLLISDILKNFFLKKSKKVKSAQSINSLKPVMSIYTNSIQNLALPKIPLIKESQKEADFAGR